MCVVYTCVHTHAHAYKPEGIQCSALSVTPRPHSIETGSLTKPEAGPARAHPKDSASCALPPKPWATGSPAGPCAGFCGYSGPYRLATNALTPETSSQTLSRLSAVSEYSLAWFGLFVRLFVSTCVQ